MDEIKEKDLVQYDEQEKAKEIETSLDSEVKEEIEDDQIDQSEEDSILTFKLENYYINDSEDDFSQCFTEDMLRSLDCLHFHSNQ